MAEYEVYLKSSPDSRMRVEADSPKQAIENYSKISGNPESSEISVRKIDENSDRQIQTSSTREDDAESLLSHRDKLRDNTAYPILRIINLLNSLAIVLISLIWGAQVGDEAVVIFGIVGVVVAILSYSLTSVFFDVADSNINTSKNSERKE